MQREYHGDAFILKFGESNLRRRAFFDGIDCSDYFLHTKLRKEETPKQNLE
jgi:hypothetical protein